MDKKKDNRLKILQFVGKLLVIISIYFLVKKLIKMNIDYNNIFKTEYIVKLIPILLLHTLSILLSCLPWQVLISSMIKKRISFSQVCFVFTKANIMKYIPGNVFQYVGRAELIQLNPNINITILTASIIIETAATVFAAAITGIIGAYEYLQIFLTKYTVIFSITTALMIIGVICIVIFRNKINDFLVKNNIFITIRLAGGFLIAVIILMLILCLNGIMLTYIIQMVSGVDCSGLVRTICGAYAISWLAGYITPGASGGIGVRETILVILLENAVTAESVLLAALIQRIVNIIADLSAYGITRMIKIVKRINS